MKYNVDLLRAEMTLRGDRCHSIKLSEILNISRTSAYNKLYGVSDWKVSEVLKLMEYYELSWDKIGDIFDDKHNDCERVRNNFGNIATNYSNRATTWHI